MSKSAPGSIVTAAVAAFALIRGAAAAEESVAEPAAEDAPATTQPLDLRPPDITKLYTRDELDRMLTRFNENIEEVEVEGARVPAPTFTPPVWRGVAAPVWALLNPLQAWRIFAPIPPDRARHIGADEPDATSGYLDPAGVPR